MKGQPITEVEYLKMLKAVKKVRPDDASAWTRYLQGLWLSGLRLRESIDLSWDSSTPISVRHETGAWVLEIVAGYQKNGKATTTPITPDFAELLERTPLSLRVGRVFPLINENGGTLNHFWVSTTVIRIATNAGIQRSKGDASAHDFRRAFCTRWASRVLNEIPNVVSPAMVASWEFYLRGLSTSGLRLEESLNLYWDDDGKLLVTFLDNEIFLKIPAELEKGNRDRLLPLAPEFQDLLRQTPEDERHGPVFKLPSRLVGKRLCKYRVSEIVRAIGQKANVLVNNSLNKYASAHDLRRSFGERWASRVMPQVLMELMRHESIETTLKYYVGRDAQRTARVVREAYNRERTRET